MKHTHQIRYPVGYGYGGEATSNVGDDCEKRPLILRLPLALHNTHSPTLMDSASWRLSRSQETLDINSPESSQTSSDELPNVVTSPPYPVLDFG